MRIVNPQYLMDLRTNMQLVQEKAYASLAQRLVWDQFATTKKSSSKKEIFQWLVQSATLDELPPDGMGLEYEQLAFQTAEVTVSDYGKAFRLSKNEFEDIDGKGENVMADWVEQQGARFAYHPQKLITDMLKVGHSTLCYDGQYLFATAHPNHPKNSANGTYSNLITDKPIDTAESMDTALNNLTAVIASIQSVKQADGVSPRNLMVKGIACGPKLYPRAVQLCNAKFIAQSTAGTGDVEAVVASMGLGQPILVPELAGFESDTTYFVIAEQIGGGEIGPR